MKKLITKLSEEFHERMSEPDGWGTRKLPNNYDITFDFTRNCELELRKDIENSPGCCSTVNCISFNMLKNGDWITIKDFEQKLEELFKDVKFSAMEIKKYLE